MRLKTIMYIFSYMICISIFMVSCTQFKMVFPNRDPEESDDEGDIKQDSDSNCDCNPGNEAVTDIKTEVDSEEIWSSSVTVPYKYKSVIHICSEDAMLTGAMSDEFYESSFIDLSVSQNIEKEILGTKYSLSYVNSIIMHESGIAAHVYSIDGLDHSEIYVDAKDGSIIKYVLVPYDEDLITEEDYKSFVNDMVDDKMDVSKYEYLCFTNVTEQGDKAIWNETVKGFVALSENQTFSSYDMRFVRKIGGIRTDEGVEATFYDGKRFSMDIVRRDYDERTFLPFIETFDELESHTYDLIKNSVSDDVVFVDTYVTGYSFFTRNGVPCVKVSSSVSNDMIYPTGKTTYTGFVQTISYLVPA